MEKIKTILRKEWHEVFKNKMVLFSVIFLPLLMTAIPLATLAGMQNEGIDAAEAELPQQYSKMCSEDLTAGECFQVYLVSSFMVMFMIIPLFVPVNIASYSIVGEKTNRTLEPILATPITTVELLAGKNLAAVIPAVLATWIGYAIFTIGLLIISNSRQVISALLAPVWFAAIFVVGPLMAVLSVNFSIMVSSRVNDPRVAEQISAVIILPIVALFMGQIFGLSLITNLVVWIMIIVLILLDALLIYLAIQLFQRETILTRWR